MGVSLSGYYLLMEKFSSADTSSTIKKSERLKELLASNRSRNTSLGKTQQLARTKPQTITVYFSWYNFDIKKEKYCQVREVMGGGRRTAVISRNSGLQKLEEISKSFFFPGGKNVKKKRLTSFHYFLADFALQELPKDYDLPDIGVNGQFTIDKYIKVNALNHTKINFVTKLFSKHTNDVISALTSFDSEDDFQPEIKTSTPISIDPVYSSSDRLRDEMIERRALIEEQDSSYQQSLEADKKKDDVSKIFLQFFFHLFINIFSSGNYCNKCFNGYKNFGNIFLFWCKGALFKTKLLPQFSFKA